MADSEPEEGSAGADAPPPLNGLAESLALAAVQGAPPPLKANSARRRRARGRLPTLPPAPPGTSEAAANAELGEATRYLHKQARMLDIQMEHLSEQRGLSLSHLRLRRVTELLKLGLQVLTVIVGLAVAGAVVALVMEARRSEALVIEPFRAPPDLAQRGLDGPTLATQLLDKLAAIEDATNSARSPQTYVHNWGEDIKVAIPETGVSIGELRRYLHQWLGRDVHITGEVYRGWLSGGKRVDFPPDAKPDGLFLTVRAGSAAGATVPGADPDLDDMLQIAAERLLHQTQPYRHAVYLARTDRRSEAIEALKVIAARGAPADRPWAYSYWGGLIALETGDVRAAADKARAALKLDPGLAVALDNLAGDESLLGHDQAAADAFAESARVLETNRAGSLAKPVRPILLGWARLRVAEAQGDYAEVERQAALIEAMPDYDGSARGALIARAGTRALRHEPTASRQLLAGLEQTDPAQEYRASLEWDPNLLPRLIQLRAVEDWPAMASLLEGSDAWPGDKAPLARAALVTKVGPSRAYLLARTGDVARAEAFAAGLPGDCYACVRARARIAAMKGDVSGSDRLFAEAVRRAPRLPAAELDWARVKLDRGDVAGAVALAKDAAAKGPRWAEPQALWGEALLRQGDASGAVKHFAEAEPFAPRWGGLHLLWGQALARMGRRDAARALWRRAAGEDLSASERSLVASLLR